ncbi:MAG: hypothetical protein H8E46_12355 [FCB group bacterium]|nr:hypothetical protein [FCB group bacterium]
MRFQVIKSKSRLIRGEYEVKSGLDIIDKISNIDGFDRDRIYALIGISENGKKTCSVYKIHTGASVDETSIMEEIALLECLDCPVDMQATAEPAAPFIASR